MKKIVVVIKKRALNCKWGFIFNTNIQSDVEAFMMLAHYGSKDYTLYFENDAPKDGIYTEVKVRHEKSSGRVNFKIKY